MTEIECEEHKRLMRMNAHTGICISTLYPGVERIEIYHEREHRSFCGISHQEGTWIITPQCEAYFFLDCLNHECSSAGFNLGGIISNAILGGMTEVIGEMDCEGQEAPDHPEQSCEGCLKYAIKIRYK